MKRHLHLPLIATLTAASPVVRAQTPAPPKSEAAQAGVGTQPAPNIGSVKDVVKDAVKGALPTLPAEAKPVAPAEVPKDPTARAAMLRRKTLKDDDFLEDERNRDPFRSYLRIFTTKEGPQMRKVPAIFEKFALEELTLIAIVSGDANPMAMFRDPGGLGQTLRRGQYLSKSGARISKILTDRVILELNEITPNGETRVLEKPVLVDPESAQPK